MSSLGTEASEYLKALAHRVMVPYIELPGTRAVLLIGSAAEGESDYFSDLDLALYHDALPTTEELTAARETNGGIPKWEVGERDEGRWMESYMVEGVECQFAHVTLAAWELAMDQVLVDLDVMSPLQKALEGLLYGVPLHGEGVIAAGKKRAADYPDALAEAMVKHYLKFFPLWYLHERLATRDATLWRYQALVEDAQNLLGVLAGLNRLYYSTFQHKRTGRFIRKMKIAPDRAAERLEHLFARDSRDAGDELERLVEETVALVERHMPQVDTSNARSLLGKRQEPWTLRAD